MKEKKINRMEITEVADLAIRLLDSLRGRMSYEGWEYEKAFQLSYLIRTMEGQITEARGLNNATLLRHSRDFAELVQAQPISPQDPFAD